MDREGGEGRRGGRQLVTNGRMEGGKEEGREGDIEGEREGGKEGLS